MAWLKDFYKKRKNPWVGFVLVMLLAPFGFLYHSWKTAILVLFVVGPLWIAFLRHTRFDLIDNPVAHYVALALLASFASLQIVSRNRQIETETARNSGGTRTQILDLALSFLPSDVDRKAFQEYLTKNPALSEKLQSSEFAGSLLFEPQDPFTRWQISQLLTSYGTMQGDAGDFSGASGTLVYSLLFFEDNPLAWGTLAEIYTAWQDRIGARWANKVLKFKPSPSPSEMINSLYSDPAVLTTIQEMKDRMVLLMRTCAEHPEWRDSYSIKRSLSYCRDL